MSNFEQLGARERQIVEAVYRLGEGSVSDVLAALADAPSYSAVRAMLNILSGKGHLDYRLVKNKYLYRPAGKIKAAQKTMLRSVVDNFFGGETAEAVATLLDGTRFNEADYHKLRELLENVKRDGAKRTK
jgi:predicted transcriptional regulator